MESLVLRHNSINVYIIRPLNYIFATALQAVSQNRCKPKPFLGFSGLHAVSECITGTNVHPLVFFHVFRQFTLPNLEFECFFKNRAEKPKFRPQQIQAVPKFM
jgi:hypothetical protein